MRSSSLIGDLYDFVSGCVLEINIRKFF